MSSFVSDRVVKTWFLRGRLLPTFIRSSSLTSQNTPHFRTLNLFGLKMSSSPFLRKPSILGSRFRQYSIMSSQAEDSCRLVEFSLSPSRALKIQIGDITKWFIDGSSDAIVNPANEGMLGGGGADGAIHKAAGPELKEACLKVPEVRTGIRCPTGEARITRGYKLPASHVIYTVGPIYDTDSNPQASLENAYKNSLRVAKENNIQYIAFPAISCGVYGYPYDEAADVAICTVQQFGNDLKEVHFVLFSDEIYNAWLKKAKELFKVGGWSS